MQEEAVAVSQQREQLVLAEKLFGMDITSYPDLIQVCDVRLLGACRHVCKVCSIYIFACAAEMSQWLQSGCINCSLIGISGLLCRLRLN